VSIFLYGLVYILIIVYTIVSNISKKKDIRNNVSTRNSFAMGYHLRLKIERINKHKRSNKCVCIIMILNSFQETIHVIVYYLIRINKDSLSVCIVKVNDSWRQASPH
jgi:hypothetical protein